MKVDLAIVVVLWNPLQHARMAANIQAWRSAMPSDPAVQVWIAEVLAPGQLPQFPAGSTTIHFLLEDHIWCIESARNALIRKFVHNADAVVCMDADLIFEHPLWWKGVLSALEMHPLIQPFETAIWLDKEGKPEQTRKSFAAGCSRGSIVGWPVSSGNHHTGFAWAARRDLWDRVFPGMPDWVCLGPNDKALALACSGQRHPTLTGWWQTRLDTYTAELQTWFGSAGLGYAPLTVHHLWHGDHRKRRYAERAQRLHKVDWPKHCRYNVDGLLCWTEEGQTLHEPWLRRIWQDREEEWKPSVESEHQPTSSSRRLAK